MIKLLQTLLIFLTVFITVNAQNGISYKALIKDANGNVLSNESIDIRFTLEYDGGVDFGIVTEYSEVQTVNTDQNGIVVLTIGEGNVLSGDLSNSNWGANGLYLTTEIDIEQDGSFVNFGNEFLNTVPKAYNSRIALRALSANTADNVSGLEAIDEGGGTGYRIIGREASNYGNIGRDAIDLSYSSFANNEHGATGIRSTAMGGDTMASGISSVALGERTVASGNLATVMGQSTKAESFLSLAIGRLNIGGGSPNLFNNNDPLFEIGNGYNTFGGSIRQNALTVLKNGNIGVVTNSPVSKIHISEGLDTGLGNNDNGYLLLGETDGPNISMDNNEIMARNNGLAADLNLQIEGGSTKLGGPLSIGTETIEDTGLNELSFNADLLPDNDNFFKLGNASKRWNTIYATNGTINTSDIREKKNIKKINYGLDDILKMNPVSFNWKNSSNSDRKLGLIAQELQTLIPEVVKSHIWEKDQTTGTLVKKELDRLGVYYSDLVPVLIKAMQEQQEIILNQQEAIKRSNANYEALLDRIEKLESQQSN